MIRLADIQRNSSSIDWAGVRLLVTLVVVLLVVLPTFAVGDIIIDEDGLQVDDPRMVFGMIARAWEDGDLQTLADLVHEDGLLVTTGGTSDRTTHYSPSQAFYYFKNMFQTHRTLIFVFDKTQDASAGDRVHGMAVWKRRRPDSEKIQELKLVCVLVRQDDQWRLAEINKIR